MPARHPSRPAPRRASRVPAPACAPARAGHTLVELMLVLTIGLIVMAVVTPRLDRAAYDADAGARVVRGTLQTAQRLAVTQQADVIVGFDLANSRLRVIEDLNGNGRADTSGVGLRERVSWRPLDAPARLASPPGRVGGGSAPVTALFDVAIAADGWPSVTFHRDGAASHNTEVYLRVTRGGVTEWRAAVVAKATGRVEWWARGAGGSAPTWARRGP